MDIILPLVIYLTLKFYTSFLPLAKIEKIFLLPLDLGMLAILSVI
jgi:hypothetical protein